jgi:hypothetical protein
VFEEIAKDGNSPDAAIEHSLYPDKRVLFFFAGAPKIFFDGRYSLFPGNIHLSCSSITCWFFYAFWIEPRLGKTFSVDSKGQWT